MININHSRNDRDLSTENDNLTYILNCFTSHNEQGVSTPMISELLLSLQILLKKESGKRDRIQTKERERDRDRRIESNSQKGRVSALLSPEETLKTN